MLLVIALALGALWALYKQWISAYNYWENKGVPFYPGTFPYGSDSNLVTLKEFYGDTFDKMYKKFSPHPVFGMFVIRTPLIVARDPEIIKTVLTKEFSHFHGRHFIHFSDTDFLSQHLFNLDGEKWKVLRAKLTSAFSTGKLKAMFPLFVMCAQDFSTLLMSKLNSEADVKELIERYTSDIICSCAFGLETGVINHPDHRLRAIGVDGIQIKFDVRFKVALISIFPQIASYFSIRFNSVENGEYLRNLIKNTIEQREKERLKRNDFLDILIQLKETGGRISEDKKDITDKPFEMSLELIAAQCYMFFLAGFETSSSVQSFCLYELALHQDIQSRLTEEIEKILKKYGGVSYEAVQEMDYLDMVISETIRKYPTLPNLVRCCNKTFATSAGYKIEKDILVIIPVWSLHRDPQYFPNPENFDPERFSPENRDSVKPYTYLPFGEGPKMCIGKRFGQLQTKLGIITVLRKFRVEPCMETKVPLVMGGNSATTSPKDPIILKLVARSPA